MVAQVFLSHTKLDGKFCDRFDNVCSNVGIRRFRSDFLAIEKPSWQTIKREVEKSAALFLLIGEELVKQQASNDPDWKFTQNWISYEVGLAHERNIDVWVVCDSVEINFPVPYFNNYAPFGLEPGEPMQYMTHILEAYRDGYNFPAGEAESGTRCANCFIDFNLHATLKPGQGLICPQCLAKIYWEKGF